MTENNSNVQVPPAPQTNPQPQPRPVVNNTNTNYSNNTTDSIPSQYKPLSPWAYIGYNILFSIPVVGFIMMLVFAFDSSNNLNRRNYSRSFLYTWIISIVFVLIVVGIMIALFGVTFFSISNSSPSSFSSL